MEDSKIVITVEEFKEFLKHSISLLEENNAPRECYRIHVSEEMFEFIEGIDDEECKELLDKLDGITIRFKNKRGKLKWKIKRLKQKGVANVHRRRTKKRYIRTRQQISR